MLGWVAGEMAITDPAVSALDRGQRAMAAQLAPLMGAILVVAVGKMIGGAKTSRRATAQVALAEGAPRPRPRLLRRRRKNRRRPDSTRVSRSWRTLPDGKRDYAAYHDKSEFRVLAPISSHLRQPRSH